jgi:uncharacterized tellurite resistance protein B-like protein
MISKLKALLTDRPGPDNAGTADPNSERLRVATSALLIEAASMDGHFDENEQRTIAALLKNHFELNAEDTDDLMEEGRKVVADSSDLYGFTRIIKDNFSEEERIRMIEMLWEVAYSDSELHHFEANFVRRVTGLIYVSDRESGEARKRVLTTLGLNEPPTS